MVLRGHPFASAVKQWVGHGFYVSGTPSPAPSAQFTVFCDVLSSGQNAPERPPGRYRIRSIAELQHHALPQTSPHGPMMLDNLLVAPTTTQMTWPVPSGAHEGDPMPTAVVPPS